MKKIKSNITLKKQINEQDSEEINQNILYLLNEARTSPKSFYKHLNINDNNNIELLNFLNYSSFEVAPLILEPNLSVCSKDLLEHILSGNINNEEEMDINSLKERLMRLNLIPINYCNFIIMDAVDPIDALLNLFLNSNYRNKVLDPDINYIGIASGKLKTGNICVIIDIVESLKSINKNLDENSIYKAAHNNSTHYTDHRTSNNKRIYIKENNTRNIGYSKYKNIIKDNIIEINKDIFPYYVDFKYKYPISVCKKRKYIKDKYGNLHIIYDLESNYDDGSVLIQTNI